jgi:ubiquinol-cytochrome c reductase cytochrome c subunit
VTHETEQRPGSNKSVRQLSATLTVVPRLVVAALSRQRRRKVAPFLLLIVCLGVTGGAYAAFAPSPQASAATGVSAQSIKDGHDLFQRNCSSCHGLNAEGSSDAPGLVGVGAAAVDFQVGTGRMPAAADGPQIQQKRVEFKPEEIAALAAYVASLGPGPAIPDKEALDYADADAAQGGAIYRTNCSMCHNFVGSGGALTHGKYAPSLNGVSAKHMYEAMLTGPQSMPVFGNGTVTPQDKKEIIAYLKLIQAQPNPGGAGLGKVGPVTEGAVGWIAGIGSLIGAAVWLGAKAR